MLVVASSLFSQPKRKQTDVSKKGFMREGIDDSGKHYAYGFSITSAILVSIGVGSPVYLALVEEHQWFL